VENTTKRVVTPRKQTTTVAVLESSAYRMTKTVWHQQTTIGLHMRIATVCFFRSVGMSAFVRADFCKMSYSEYLLKSVDTSGFL